MTEEELRDLAACVVGRLDDNRLHGLLAELVEAISEEEDPQKLRRFGSALHQVHNLARSKAYRINPKGGY